MPRHQLRQRIQPDLSAHVQASLDSVQGVFNPENGFYGTMNYTGIETRERAAELKRGLHRAARYLKVSMAAKIVKNSDHDFTIVYQAINKEHARAYVVNTYGSNRQEWPLLPFPW